MTRGSSTSMIMANGTHMATAQHTPTRLMKMVAWTTVEMKNVEKVKRPKKRRAPVQMLRRRKGITGSSRGFPARAASILHCRTRSLSRAISASPSTSLLWPSNLRSRFARWGRIMPATTPTTRKMNKCNEPTTTPTLTNTVNKQR